MPSVSSQGQPAKLIKVLAPLGAFQPNLVRVLVVSPELESRQKLLQTLEAFPADAVVCSNRAQAEEVLSHQSFELIFCDAHLSDGSYAELLRKASLTSPGTRLVVTVREKDSEFSSSAAAEGAFAVVRWPGVATDIELTLLRAMRRQNQLAYSAVA